MAEKVLAAMSGGVDSSVAAYLLQKDGYNVIGAMMKLYENEDIGEDVLDSCCSLASRGDAESVAASLDIPFYVYNYAEEFRLGVMDAFAAEYERGRTPNPCVECNRLLKFGVLLERADKLGCAKVATGHYLRVQREANGRYILRRGVDEAKDQSYALFFMTQEQLARALFPLGGLTKPEVREIAREIGLENAEKRDSQDICFVPHGEYAEFLEKYTGKTPPPGDFIGPDGRIMGRHRGISSYTIGQRRGLGLPTGERVYVRELDVERNAVLLGDNASLYRKTLIARNINIIPVDRLDGAVKLAARIRYGQREVPATVWQTEQDELRVEFDAPQRAITNGQYVVLYDGDIVVGGGTIDSSE